MHLTVDHHHQVHQVACSFFAFAYKAGVANLPNGLSAKEFTCQQLDRLGIGEGLTPLSGAWNVQIAAFTVNGPPLSR